jgi:hypothetical protein
VYSSSGELTLDHDTVANNSAPGGNGGGVYADAITRVLASTISANVALYGAGVYDGDVLALVNSTIAGNSGSSGGSGGGGGVYEYGDLSLDNATIVGNSAGSGGGGNLFINSGFATAHDTLIAGGSLSGASGSENCSTSGGLLTSQGYNLEDRDQCSFDGATDQHNAAPAIGSLASNGGATQTIALLSGSPAINAGDPAGCTDDNGAVLTTDQRDVVRPQGGRCDIGAYEFVPPQPAPAPPAPVAPQLSSLNLSPSSFAAKAHGASIASSHKPAKGTTVSYTDSQAATTTLVVQRATAGLRVGSGPCTAPPKHRLRHAKSCVRYVAVGSFTHADVAGANHFHFTGRVGGHALKRGSYHLVATPKLGALSGLAVTQSFTIS